MLVGIGLFVGSIITGSETTLADDDLNDHCSDNPYNSDNNRACHHLKGIYNLLVAVTVSECTANSCCVYVYSCVHMCVCPCLVTVCTCIHEHMFINLNLLWLQVVNVICMVLLAVLVSWDVFYIYKGLNHKIPVPRARDQVNQQ